MTLTDVVHRVQSELDSSVPQGRGLRAMPEFSREEDEWYYVVVAPTTAGWNAMDLLDMLGAVEKKLRSTEHLQVLLVPASDN